MANASSSGFTNPRSHRGTKTDWSAWRSRRKQNLRDAAEITTAIGGILYERHKIKRAHKEFADPHHDAINLASSKLAKHSHNHIHNRRLLNDKKKLRNIHKEIMEEIKTERQTIDARYHAATSHRHAWNPFDWGAITKAKADRTADIIKYNIKFAAAHIWTPGLFKRQDMYKRQLATLSYQNVRMVNSYKEIVRERQKIIAQNWSDVSAKRPSVVDYLKTRFRPAANPGGGGSST